MSTVRSLARASIDHDQPETPATIVCNGDYDPAETPATFA
jgi:hypothetical protein